MLARGVELPPDEQSPRGEFDVPPLQPQRLPDPQPGEGEQREHRPAEAGARAGDQPLQLRR